MVALVLGNARVIVSRQIIAGADNYENIYSIAPGCIIIDARPASTLIVMIIKI